MLTQNPALRRTLISWSAPLLLVLVSGLLQWQDWILLLRYQRDLIETGQLWRLFTGNLVHLGWPHWLLNSAGLLLVWALLEPSVRTMQSAAILLTCCLLVGAGLYAFSPNVGWYVGLSGALHGLLIAGLIRQMRQQPGFSLLVLVIVIGKLLWEQRFGPLPGSERSAGGPVVVVAHAYGAIAGGVIALLQYFYFYLKSKI
jgi:rhomboid family GlyGly-CTERM serine protease